MRHSAINSENDRYERACDQAISMCDGNLRSTIKALLMANEFLEGEIQELQRLMTKDSLEGFPMTQENVA